MVGGGIFNQSYNINSIVGVAVTKINYGGQCLALKNYGGSMSAPKKLWGVGLKPGNSIMGGRGG